MDVSVFERRRGKQLKIRIRRMALTTDDAVGRIVGPNTLQAADGTNITLDTDNVAEALVVNPEMCVEIMGSAQDATTIVVRSNKIPSETLLALRHTYCKRISFCAQSP